MHSTRDKRNEYIRKYRAANAEQFRARHASVRAARKAYAIAKLGGACISCGSTVDLQFDHIDPFTKRDAITRMLTLALSTLDEELAKCQLLCKPCHKIKTKGNNDQFVPAEHGTAARYTKHGCRCEQCRLWKRAYDIAWKAKRRESRSHEPPPQTT